MNNHNQNVLFITADQLQARCIHESLVKTPNLDALMSDGAISFNNNYCNSTPCGPARASLHTGCYMMNNSVNDNGCPINPRLPNWADVLREQRGYDPILVGYVDQIDVSNGNNSVERQSWDGGELPGLRRLTGKMNALKVSPFKLFMKTLMIWVLLHGWRVGLWSVEEKVRVGMGTAEMILG